MPLEALLSAAGARQGGSEEIYLAPARVRVLLDVLLCSRRSPFDRPGHTFQLNSGCGRPPKARRRLHRRFCYRIYLRNVVVGKEPEELL